jgi:uncharacterized membrane protein
MLNHVPVIGIPLIVLVLAAGALWKNAAILRLGLALIVLVAAVSVGTFVSGEPAEEAVESLAGIAKPSIETHEDAARAAMVGIELLGLVALLGLIAFRGRLVPVRFAWTVMALGIVVGSWMAWTAHLGGLIHHDELRSAMTAGETATAEDDERD